MLGKEAEPLFQAESAQLSPFFDDVGRLAVGDMEASNLVFLGDRLKLHAVELNIEVVLECSGALSLRRAGLRRWLYSERLEPR